MQLSNNKLLALGINELVAAVSDELFASSGTGNEHLASFDISYDQLAERSEGNEYIADPIEIAGSI